MQRAKRIAWYLSQQLQIDLARIEYMKNEEGMGNIFFFQQSH